MLNIYPNTEGQKARAPDLLEIGHMGSNRAQFDPEVDGEEKERMKQERKTTGETRVKLRKGMSIKLIQNKQR